MVDLSPIEKLVMDINERLVGAVELIRLNQPKRNGAVLLYLHDCGKGCDFCPHPKWELWVGGTLEKHRWHKVQIDSPLRYTRRKNFPQAAKECIREACELIRYRSLLATRIKTLKQSAAPIRKALETRWK